jgi:hypothetical protein
MFPVGLAVVVGMEEVVAVVTAGLMDGLGDAVEDAGGAAVVVDVEVVFSPHAAKITELARTRINNSATGRNAFFIYAPFTMLLSFYALLFVYIISGNDPDIKMGCLIFYRHLLILS